MSYNRSVSPMKRTPNRKTTILLIITLALSFGGCEREASFHREYRQLISDSAKPQERHYYELEYQVLCVVEKGPLAPHLTTEDGVDEFEAWMLAKIYSGEEIGLCLDLGLPERHQQTWEVPTFVGRPGKKGPPVVIDSTSGKITCEGHPTVARPREYLAAFDSKFKK